MKNPLVSIILPTYNEEKYIGVCIESLLKQSYKPVEIIIVDDGSKDKTVEIIKKYPVHLFEQKHGGPGNARNLGVYNSMGDILMIWASDQIFGKDYIKDLIKPILKYEARCTLHQREKIANKDKLWARAWGERDYSDRKSIGATVASILPRTMFYRGGGYDSKLGYADDQAIFNKLGVRAKLIDTEIYHFNPETMKETFAQTVWIGASLKKPLKALLGFPLFPLYAIYKSLKHLKKDFYIPFIAFLPFFYSFKYFGFVIGILRRYLFGKNTRI